MEDTRTDSMNILEHRPIIEDFYKEWFRCAVGREASKSRQFVSDTEDFLRFVESCKQNRSACYLSVQPYKERNTVQEIEKLFFDFDSPGNLEQAWQDAKKLADCLEQYYGAESLVVFSGSKGYHLYTWLVDAVEVESPLAGKTFCRILQRKVTAGLKLSTLDPTVVGDIKRLSRVPYTIHEKSGRLCVPVAVNREPVLVPKLDGYRQHGLSQKFIELCKVEANSQLEKPSHTFSVPYLNNVRPCILEALNQPLQKKEGHLMRIAIGREYLNAGFQVSEIVQFFQVQNDFDAGRTRYYLEYLQSNKCRPFKCKTINDLGFCLGSTCLFYRKKGEQH
jgi:DNA primase catalytic subunit